jgi:diguanylate cyclase (GGDEF)-like protein
MMVFPAVTTGLGSHVQTDVDESVDIQSLCYAHDLRELMQVHDSLNQSYQSLMQRVGQTLPDRAQMDSVARVQLSWLVLHDSLTGLANRWALGEQMDAHLHSAHSKGQSFALLHIGVDGWETYALGERHALLREAAGRLQRVVRRSDLLARVGKGTFAVMLRDVHLQDDINRVADKLLAALSVNMFTGKTNDRVTCSLGCARYPFDGIESHVLSRHADAALHVAQQEGCGNVRFHAQVALASSPFNMGLALWGAAVRGELKLAYQPIWTMGAQAVLVGYQASMCWHHPLRGELNPDEFLPVAARNGAIHVLGEWMLNEVLRQLASWRSTGCKSLRVSVSVAPTLIESSDFADRLLRWAELAGVSPMTLELDVTNPEPGQAVPGQATLQRLRENGFRVALACSRQALATVMCALPMPVDCIRLDRQLVQALPGSEQALARCRCYAELGVSLGVDVLAECVENQEQWQALKALGCGLAQGFLNWVPLPSLAPGSGPAANDQLPGSQPERGE